MSEFTFLIKLKFRGGTNIYDKEAVKNTLEKLLNDFYEPKEDEEVSIAGVV